MTSEEAAYIAGLFDGEGTITYKKYFERKKKVMWLTSIIAGVSLWRLQ
jgi:intein/homing endonuclease